jgi:3-dehydroquinate synthase
VQPLEDAICGYPIVAAGGGAEEVAELVERLRPTGRLLVVSDSNVGPLYAKPLADELRSSGREVREFTVEAGESSKCIAVMERLWNEAFAGPIDRDDAVVAVGGGVVGDLGGFLASTLMRGIPVVQVPTSVLAMSDAAIGGKTGINLSAGKNLVGAFHRPCGVIQWIGALPTLSEREHRSGLAEVVKSAMIEGEDAFAALERGAGSLVAGDPGVTQRGVMMAAHLKARVVHEDEHEGGLRRLLNLGHTFGHALERSSGYGEWTHGECVAVGMVIVCRYGESIGFTDSAVTSRLVSLLESLKLPVSTRSLRVDEWLDPMLRDKKRSGDAIRLILCRKPGVCETVKTPITEIAEWVRTQC